jgi:hypothetical protein
MGDSAGTETRADRRQSDRCLALLEGLKERQQMKSLGAHEESSTEIWNRATKTFNVNSEPLWALGLESQWEENHERKWPAVAEEP